MGGGNDTHVDLPPLVAPHVLDDPILHDAENLRLKRKRCVADLVQEERAPVGELDLARPLGDRPGEGAAFMTEQLALEELERHRGL